MRQTWNLAIAFVLLGVLTIGFGLWTMHLSTEREHEVSSLEAASLELDRYERDGTLADRSHDATERRNWLAARLAASVGGASSLDARLGELFPELQLSVASTTPWTAAEDSLAPSATEFERTLQCSGAFAAVLDLLASLEAWPDLLRVRSLTVVPVSPGKVDATIVLSVLRLPLDTTAGEDPAAVSGEGS